MSVRTAFRPLRAAVFAAVCVAVTAVGHGLEGGGTAGPLALGVAFAVVFSGALVAGGCERSGSAITGLLLGGQWVLHMIFNGLGSGPAMPAGDGHAGMAGSGVGMPVVHLAIGVLAGWWLRRGEIACWRLVRRVESATVAALRVALDHLAGFAAGSSTDGPDGVAVGPVRAEPGGGMTLLRARCAPRRGPPRPRSLRPVGV